MTGGHVTGWDDPRMPTLAGIRRRGYTPEAMRDFCDRIGVAKRNSVVEVELLEHCLREDLNRRAPRFMGVLDPVRVVLTNWPEGAVEMLDAVNNPEDASKGTRAVPFSGTLFIDRDDFREVPPPKYHRLSPGCEVRLRWAYVIRCTQVVKDSSGAVVELRCTYDPATKGGEAPGRKVKGTIHWVSAGESTPATVRLYDRLFSVPNPDDAPEGRDFLANLSPDSLVVKSGARVEPALSALAPGTHVPARANGLFRRRRGQSPGASRPEPVRLAARLVGKDREESPGTGVSARRRVLLWAPVALLLAHEFWLSSRTGAEMPSFGPSFDGKDKLEHAAYFFLTGVLAVRAARFGERWSRGKTASSCSSARCSGGARTRSTSPSCPAGTSRSATSSRTWRASRSRWSRREDSRKGSIGPDDSIGRGSSSGQRAFRPALLACGQVHLLQHRGVARVAVKLREEWI